MMTWSTLLMMGMGLMGFNPMTARTIPVLTIESDAMPDATHVAINTDDEGNLAGLTSTSPETVVSFNLTQLRQKPQVFKNMDGHDVVYFSVESDFNPRSGGHANMRFLVSGISDTYKNFRMRVIFRDSLVTLVSEPNSNDPESDGNRYTSQFNYLYMNQNTFWGQTVGIESVVPQMR